MALTLAEAERQVQAMVDDLGPAGLAKVTESAREAAQRVERDARVDPELKRRVITI